MVLKKTFTRMRIIASTKAGIAWDPEPNSDNF